MHSTTSNFFFNQQGEFRLLWLYFPIVITQGLLASIYPPIIDVFWDSVFYKNLAFGFYHYSSFDLNNHFPVPPFYPLLLSLTCFIDDFMTLEYVHTWLNPALFYLGLYPLYSLSRILLDRWSAVGACLLYMVYPYSVCTHWTMSENLAIPLAILTVYQCALLLREDSTLQNGLFAGVSTAALMLTRIQAVSICGPLYVWIIFRVWRTKHPWKPLLCAISISASLVLVIWGFIGYFSSSGSSPIYPDIPLEQSRPSLQLLWVFIARFLFHWMALWLEGGMIIPTALVFVAFYVMFNKSSFTFIQRELIYLLFVIAVCNVAIISWIMAFSWGANRPDRLWTVFLRYFCYANIISLPAAIVAMGTFKNLSKRERFQYLALYGGITLFGFLGFHMPHVWDSLKRLPYYFTNAPSLDFVLQIYGEGVWVGSLFLLFIAMLVGWFVLWNRIVGILITFICFTYILACGIDYQLEQQLSTIQRWGYTDIHKLCGQLEKGRWRKLPLYTHEVPSSLHLRANLQYWLDLNPTPLKPDAPKPQPPYLLITFEKLEKGKLVFLSGELRAYLFKENKKKPAS